jgi:hypothetical protein
MPGMGVSQTTGRSAVRLSLVTDPPPVSPDAPTGVPAGLRLLRSLDRAVLEVAREHHLRAMELYALLLLADAAGDGPVTTRGLSDLLSASSSQAKQIALRLCGQGYAVRSGAKGRTSLTPEGFATASQIGRELERAMAARLARLGERAVADDGAALTALAQHPLA